MTDPSIFRVYRRRPTREVRVGDVGVGGTNPIRVQSMTTPATSDVEATSAQIRRLVEAGCEIVRLTVPSTRDAEALPAIRRRLEALGIRVPLVADIHFSPAAAMMTVEHVEKVRINPGNYADTKKFKIREYSDAEYLAELERIEERFKPLVRRAKERGVSLRIGTNHGSLSDRILNRYGDTPLGMVESALEFVRICERHGFREIILSMKSSNPMVMIQAYRLLAGRMAQEGMDYPFHLGVTEAGDGEDGRIKSAVGIGSLLEDGIGDTLRVSLTEDPVAEIPVAFALAEKYNVLQAASAGGRDGAASFVPPAPSASTYARRPSSKTYVGGVSLGGGEPVRVESLLAAPLGDVAALATEILALSGAPALADARAEILEVDLDRPADLSGLRDLSRLLHAKPTPPALSIRSPLAALARLGSAELGALGEICHRVTVRLADPGAGSLDALGKVASSPALRAALCLQSALPGDPEDAIASLVGLARGWKEIRGTEPILALDLPAGAPWILLHRRLAAKLSESGLASPLLLVASNASRREDPLLFTSVELGALLCDGLGDAVRVEGFGSPADSLRLGFNVLQGTRLRLIKTEFISCPSCGRTQFDLEETTRRIKARTGHLKGVKIAIMGCIVNGPGEMADADFGYVGWGPGKVSLFVGKDLVEKDIPFAEADERLIHLIQAEGKWIDPVNEAPLPAGRDRE
ncbi:MAG TPA: (E)-4-hydroxy-3-methylbut-2-enyl-diphosphate synthase [Candidatus Polarisedimenticolia bacterium]|jgi:(E)-4-hydroxy-3-methylbut-2-enyl-diphosphate synthase|nr:(E)-4-hydroxy-3-methylbut-2-enyl-diphosphate synthase [Candidatus Polarisedimenticolia bacterium]